MLLKRKFHCFSSDGETGERSKWYWESEESMRPRRREKERERETEDSVEPCCHDCGHFYKHPLSTLIFIVSLCNKSATQMMQKSYFSGVL